MTEWAFRREFKRWKQAEAAFAAAGFRPVSLNDLFSYGGGFTKRLEDFPERLAEGETAICYAPLYEESQLKGDLLWLTPPNRLLRWLKKSKQLQFDIYEGKEMAEEIEEGSLEPT